MSLCCLYFPQFSLTPLHLACWYGQESVVRLLLRHGANVNAVDRVSWIEKVNYYIRNKVVFGIFIYVYDNSLPLRLEIKTYHQVEMLQH